MNAVVDASVAIKWYVEEDFCAKAELLLEDPYRVQAPELLMPEFGSILWKKVRRKDLTETGASAIITAFQSLDITYHSHVDVFRASFEGAQKSGQTVYDWSYLALAVSLGCKFVTADEKFYNALKDTSLRKHLLWIGDL